jgi:DNA-directed RNA polymerase specialized sigma24 family protein
LGYLDELFRYAMVLTRNQTDAEDLVQETKSNRLRMKHDEYAARITSYKNLLSPRYHSRFAR